ncbi:hypothetical protein ACHAW5_006986 [Stephanodiscus triporus]|uniref:Peroxisomal membrane protein PEX16 n=1 Tax=Stephanodiscus triporus TaxID=2934178 RepID=A0ABD3P5P7_9STRA
MSNIRHRKSSTAANKDDSPPDSPQSWEKNFDNDGGNGETPTEQHTPIAVPSKLDKFLDTWTSFSAKTFTADQGLKVLQYSTWAVCYAARSKRGNLSPGLRKLYNELSMTRYVFRMFGFFQSLEGYRSGSWAGGTWDNPLIAKIAKYLLAGSMIFYYPLDHLAYAGWQMPQLVRVNANKVSQISCLFWSVYTISDFWVSCLKWKELKEKLGSLESILTGKKKNDHKEDVAALVKEEANLLNKIRHIKLQLVRCLLFVLPCINWSLPNWATDPMLSELHLNGLCLAEAYAAVYQSLCSL